MKKKNLFFSINSLAAIILTPALGFGQFDPASISNGNIGKNLDQLNEIGGNDDGKVWPQDIWYDSTWIVDTDVADAGNGAAISGMSVFGAIYDLSLADDFDCPGGDVGVIVHDYMNFNGGAYRPTTDYLIEFYSDVAGAPDDTAFIQLMGTNYTAHEINVSWWGPCTRIRSVIDPGYATLPAGFSWVSPSPVDITSDGDWYYGIRKYATGLFSDAHGRDGANMHGTIYGGPYGGGYNTSTWTSMESLGFTAGDWSMKVLGVPGLHLRVAGESCPGNFVLSVNGAMTGERVYFTYGFNSGTTPIPPCQGLELRIANAKSAGFAIADGNGNASLSGYAPGAACDRLLIQAVGVGSCTLSGIIQLKWCNEIKEQPCNGYCPAALNDCNWEAAKHYCFCKD